MSMKIHFWGVRGSIPTPGADTARYGGNTSCVSVELDNGAILIFDAGTGIRLCGNDLLSRKKPVKASIFISHTHWDHIQGFPFFVPSYIPGNDLTLYGPPSDVRDRSLESIMAMQTNYEYFPVSISQLGATIRYVDSHEGELDTGIDGLKMFACRLNHPVVCLAYRIEYADKVYVYGGDHEPFRNLYRDGKDVDMDEDFMEELDRSAEEQNAKISDFCRNADLISWDSQYTADEYQAKKGWGHSTYESNIKMAAEAKIKQLICTHHDPANTDEALDQRRKLYAKMAQDAGVNLDFSREGLAVSL